MADYLKTVAVNKAASHEYFIDEKYECGVVLEVALSYSSVINDALEDAVADFAEIVAISQAAASGTLSPEQQAQLTQMKEKSAALKAAVKKEFLL